MKAARERPGPFAKMLLQIYRKRRKKRPASRKQSEDRKCYYMFIHNASLEDVTFMAADARIRAALSAAVIPIQHVDHILHCQTTGVTND
jgi:hypothetical protein